jgi:outer membrane protein, multidrug efflux system
MFFSTLLAPSYFRTFCRAKKEIAKRTLLAREESVRIGQARLRQGLINKLDVDHFEAERENAAARIAELKRHMIQKENEISATL